MGVDIAEGHNSELRPAGPRPEERYARKVPEARFDWKTGAAVGAKMPHDIAVAIIFGRLDQDEGLAPARNSPCGGSRGQSFRSCKLCVWSQIPKGPFPRVRV